VVTSERTLFLQDEIKQRFHATQIPNNQIVTVTENCEISYEQLSKNIELIKNPKG